jgi:putative transposase
MDRQSYATDLSDREWAIVEPLVPPEKTGGRPCTWERREICNAIFYVLRSGNAWRLLPHDFPPWQTVYHYFRLWRLDGTWETIHTTLREQVRRRAGREATPSAAIMDSQSIKTTEKGDPPGTTARRRSRGVSAISSSTPWGFS